MKRIERTEYLNKLIAFKDKSLIKVITGIRRCGKSTIMEIYRDWLKRQGVSADQIIYLNFEDYDFYELRNPHNLYAYIKPLIHQDKMTYIFFDEIQHVEDFPDIINSLNLKPTVNLYITGIECLYAVKRNRHVTIRKICGNRNASPFIQRVC